MKYRKCEICGLRTERKDGQKRFFMAKFPLDEARCREWVKRTGNEDLAYVPIEKLHNLKYVCGKHFRPKDFKGKKTQLKKTAVPSLLLTKEPLGDEILIGFPLHIASYSDTTEKILPLVTKAKCLYVVRNPQRLLDGEANSSNNATTSELSETSEENCSMADEDLAESSDEFCICCLDRESPLISLQECKHGIYLDTLNLPELTEFHQLVCVHCHNVLMKIKCFQQQVQECHEILTSGALTVTTRHKRKLNHLTIQKTLHTVLGPTPQENSSNETITTSSHIEKNKNIIFALEKIDHNNQNFIGPGNQTQILNGEYYLSVVKPGVSKEGSNPVILSDVSSSNESSRGLDEKLLKNNLISEMKKDAEIILLNDSKSLSPVMINQQKKSAEIEGHEPLLVETRDKRKIVLEPNKTSKLKKIAEYVIKLSVDDLNKEGSVLDQSEANSKYKFRYECTTCKKAYSSQHEAIQHLINNECKNIYKDSISHNIEMEQNTEKHSTDYNIQEIVELK